MMRSRPTPWQAGWRRPTRQLLLLGALAALLLQSLAPPGYMPGNLSSGWPVVLCPEGLPAGFLGHDHHHHTDSSSASRHADQGLGGHCPLGGMLDTVSLSSLTASASPDAVQGDERLPGYRAPVLERRVLAHPTRAPPHGAGSPIV